MRLALLITCVLGLLILAGATVAPAAVPPPAPVSPAAPPVAPPAVPPVAPPAVPPRHPTTLTGLPPAVLADGTAPVIVRLSGPVAPNSPAPVLSPKVAGSWASRGDLETFTPSSTLEPCTTYQLTIWAQTQAVNQRPLGARRVIRLAVACPSTRAVQQALARLRYLPYRFAAAGRPSGRESRASAAHHAFKPPAGRFVRDVNGAPPLNAGALDATTRGALMVFQGAHGSAPSGSPDAATWSALIGAEAGGYVDRRPYTFVTVSQGSPERLAVHRGNRVVLTSLTNTGVAGASTADGIFPIYERFVATTMSGTNPDGSHYSDPGVPWVNYFNGGDAVHGFNRASYGSRQSDGCVELPPATASVVFRMLTLGDLVEVSG